MVTYPRRLSADAIFIKMIIEQLLCENSRADFKQEMLF
jgi:hypothetical protein